MICKDTLKVKIYEVASLLKVGAIVLRQKMGLILEKKVNLIHGTRCRSRY